MPSARDLVLAFLYCFFQYKGLPCRTVLGFVLQFALVSWRYGTASGLPPTPDRESIPHGSDNESGTRVRGLPCLPTKSDNVDILTW